MWFDWDKNLKQKRERESNMTHSALEKKQQPTKFSYKRCNSLSHSILFKKNSCCCCNVCFVYVFRVSFFSSFDLNRTTNFMRRKATYSNTNYELQTKSKNEQKNSNTAVAHSTHTAYFNCIYIAVSFESIINGALGGDANWNSNWWQLDRIKWYSDWTHCSESFFGVENEACVKQSHCLSTLNYRISMNYIHVCMYAGFLCCLIFFANLLRAHQTQMINLYFKTKNRMHIKSNRNNTKSSTKRYNVYQSCPYFFLF